MDTQEEMYILNPLYMLKNDKKRILVTYRNNPAFASYEESEADIDYFSFIHPEQAKILTLFDGKRTLREIIVDVATRLNTSQERSMQLISPLIGNKKPLGISFQGTKFVLPRNVVVPLNPDYAIENSGAYNLMSIFRIFVLQEKTQKTLSTLRYRTFAIGAYFVKVNDTLKLKIALTKKRRKWFVGLWDYPIDIALKFSIA